MSNKKHHPNTIEKADKYANTNFNYGVFEELRYEFGDPIGVLTDDKEFVKDAYLFEKSQEMGMLILDYDEIIGDSNREIDNNLMDYVSDLRQRINYTNVDMN